MGLFHKSLLAWIRAWIATGASRLLSKETPNKKTAFLGTWYLEKLDLKMVTDDEGEGWIVSPWMRPDMFESLAPTENISDDKNADFFDGQTYYVSIQLSFWLKGCYVMSFSLSNFLFYFWILSLWHILLFISSCPFPVHLCFMCLLAPDYLNRVFSYSLSVCLFLSCVSWVPVLFTVALCLLCHACIPAASCFVLYIVWGFFLSDLLLFASCVFCHVTFCYLHFGFWILFCLSLDFGFSALSYSLFV